MDAFRRDVRLVLIGVVTAKIIPVTRKMTCRNGKSLSIAILFIRPRVFLKSCIKFLKGGNRGKECCKSIIQAWSNIRVIFFPSY